MNDDDDDYSDEIASEDDVVIVMNVHLPSTDAPKTKSSESFQYYRNTIVHEQFHPTNAIWLPSLKYVPSEEDPNDPKPWREFPSTMHEYFNYGFTEAVWDAYRFKQLTLRKMFSEKPQNVQRKKHTRTK